MIREEKIKRAHTGVRADRIRQEVAIPEGEEIGNVEHQFVPEFIGNRQLGFVAESGFVASVHFPVLDVLMVGGKNRVEVTVEFLVRGEIKPVSIRIHLSFFFSNDCQKKKKHPANLPRLPSSGRQMHLQGGRNLRQTIIPLSTAGVGPIGTGDTVSMPLEMHVGETVCHFHVPLIGTG